MTVVNVIGDKNVVKPSNFADDYCNNKITSIQVMNHCDVQQDVWFKECANNMYVICIVDISICGGT